MPRLDPLAKASEHLILKYNPRWTGADWHGKVPTMPEWAEDDMMLQGMFAYDEPIPFTRESWKGRIRACRGDAALLSLDVTNKFDREHDALIRDMAGESFTRATSYRRSYLAVCKLHKLEATLYFAS